MLAVLFIFEARHWQARHSYGVWHFSPHRRERTLSVFAETVALVSLKIILVHIIVYIIRVNGSFFARARVRSNDRAIAGFINDSLSLSVGCSAIWTDTVGILSFVSRTTQNRALIPPVSSRI